MREAIMLRGRAGWIAIVLWIGAALVLAAPRLTLRDRVVADVGGEAVTLRQVVLLASLEAGRVIDPGESEPLAAALDRVVVQVIIMREIAQNPSYTEDVPPVAEVRQALERRCGGPEALARLVEELQLEPSELDRLLLQQAMVSTFVKLHFNPFVYVSAEEAQKYYAEEFLPRLAPGSTPPPLEEVQEQITEILQQRKINAEFEEWLVSQKQELRVRTLP